MTTEGIASEWEKKVGLKITDPNFRYALEDKMANEPVEKVDKVLISLGLMSPTVKKTKLTTKEDVVQPWEWINDH